MLYLITGVDAPGSLENRLAARPAHLERLDQLQQAGRLVLAGPCPMIDSPDPGPAGFSGSVIVAEFESLAAAQEWAAADPYTTAGVFASTSAKPFLRVFPR
ncbi:MAG: YciI family protein [Proteobacteria bacterium]|nr:YciI family protein [Pseudomonadota bacterium]HQR02664.1 YciI family protein [Rhodocyclaceae bacterium]